ncbi:MAG: (2Fe-2S) ferredoxin domain-containing protein [Verrucomicrobiota bacterium]
MPDSLTNIATELKLSTYQRHLFLCATPTKPKCCRPEAGAASWQFLKSRLKELNLADPHQLVHRTKADCLRICVNGPIAVIYPDRIWYHSCTPENLERIIQSHLLNNTPVQDLLIPKQSDLTNS